MRNPNVNPLPYEPRTAEERQLCELVAAASGEVVLKVWTPASYPYEDLEGKQVVLEADYAVHTGQLSKGLFVGGSRYLGFVRNGRVEIELEGVLR